MRHGSPINRRRPGTLQTALSLALVATLMLVPSGSALAGNGTSGDPWHNENIWWSFTAAGSTTGLKQDIVPVTVKDSIFWELGSSLTSGNGYLYTGIQTKGILHGTSGAGAMANKVAVFSIFGVLQIGDVRMLQGNVCSAGADAAITSLWQQLGISCSIGYGWAQGVSYQLTVDITSSTSQAWCPTGTFSGTTASCRIFAAFIATTSNPGARTQVAAWSLKNTYGTPGTTNNFLEAWLGVQFCGTATPPEGRYVIPFSNRNGAWAPGSLSSSDSGQVGECGRAWADGLAARIRLVTP
jgi:hypothetical protein